MPLKPHPTAPPLCCSPRRHFRPSHCLPSGPSLSRRNPPPFPFHSLKLAANQRRRNLRPSARSGPALACPAPFLRMQTQRKKERKARGRERVRAAAAVPKERRGRGGGYKASKMPACLAGPLPLLARPLLTISLPLLLHWHCGLKAAIQPPKPILHTRTHSHLSRDLVCAVQHCQRIETGAFVQKQFYLRHQSDQCFCEVTFFGSKM